MSYIDDTVTGYINAHFVPIDPGMADLRAECEADYIPLILRETENFLRVYLSALQPESILEIGTAYGYSSIFFAKLLPAVHVTTIEREADVSVRAEENFRRFGLSDRITLLTGDAVSVMEALPADATYDFVFIDAAKSHYADYLDRAMAHCHAASVIICDNILMRGLLVDDSLDPKGKHRTNIRRMNNFIQSITSDHDLEVTLLSSGDGLAIIRRKI